jgi:branched-chain amino acid transport system substrate-binding protein
MKMKKVWLWAIAVVIVIGIVLIITTQIYKQSETINIGAVLPLTGDGALYGQMAHKAIELGVEKINSEGGIMSRKISVIYEDDQLNPQVATQAVQKLITVDKVPVIIGPMTSNALLAVAPIAEKNKVVLISPAATSHEITNAGDYIFRTIVSDIYDGTAMAQFAYNKLGFKNVGVFYVDEAGPKGVTQAFMEEFKRLGGTISAEEKGVRDGTDFRTQITKLKNVDPNAVYFAGYAKETVIFLQQAKELGLNKQLMTHQLIDDPDVIKRAGDTADGVIFTTPKLTPEIGGDTVKQFFEKFRKKYGEDPQNFAPNAYDAVMLVAKSMEKYGTNSEGIKKGLYEVKGYQGASGEITVDENGDVVQPMLIMTIQNGKVVLYQR